MKPYWDHLAADGGWDEGTGYWCFGHRYGLMAAEALRRNGHEEGKSVFKLEGVKQTGYFPMAFWPTDRISASFGDSGKGTDPDAIPVLFALVPPAGFATTPQPNEDPPLGTYEAEGPVDLADGAVVPASTSSAANRSKAPPLLFVARGKLGAAIDG